MKKRLFPALLALVMVLSLLPLTVTAAEFTDTTEHWGADAIDRWIGYDVVGGYGDGTFLPDKTMTRAEAAQTFVNLMKLTQAADISGYTDVPAGSWYADPISKCVAAGILTGTGDGAMNPGASLSREQLFTMLARALGVQPAASGASFTDNSQIHSWAAGYINALVNMGVLQGMGGGSLAPLDDINRASVMAAMDRAIGSYITSSGTYAAPSGGVMLIVGGSKVSVTGDVGGKYITVSDSGATVDLSGATGAATITVTNTAQNVAVTGAAKGTTVVAPSGSGTTVNGSAVSSGGYTVGSGSSKPSSSAGGSYGGGSGDSDHPGGGSGGFDDPQPSGTPVESATILVNDEQAASGTEVKPNDWLTVYVTPAGIEYEAQWYVGGSLRSTSRYYIVSPNDLGQTIYAKVSGANGYTGTVESDNYVTVTNTVAFDPTVRNKGDAPVVVGNTTTFVDEAGKPVTVDEDSVITLTVEANTNATASTTETAALTATINDAVPAEVAKPAANQIKYIEVDAKLEMQTSSGTEEIHPVGNTTLNLSRETLGVSADDDLNKYIFVAYHENQNHSTDQVVGTVIGNQYVRFELGGLSTVWLGTVPPLTVKFNTDGGSPIPDQQVKYGGQIRNVVPPVKEGYLFDGWDRDIGTRIISDTTFKAKWFQGSVSPVTQSQLTPSWTVGESPVTPNGVDVSVANGVITVELENYIAYEANLTFNYGIAAPTGATKYALASNAQAAYDASTYTDGTSFTGKVAVADANGAPLVSSTTHYIKWVDAGGDLVSLQSVSIVVRTENSSAGVYDTDTRVERVDVDRGFGRLEVYMTNGSGDPEDCYASFRSGLYGNRNTGYYLDLDASLGWYSVAMYDETTGQYLGRHYYDVTQYETVVIEVTPFDGDSFVRAPSASAYYNAGSTWNPTTINVDSGLDSSGKIVLTFAIPDVRDTGYGQTDVYVTMTSGAQRQEIRIPLNYYQEIEDPSRPGTDDPGEGYYSTDVWAEAVAAVKAGRPDVIYYGEDDATLTGELTLGAGQSLNISAASLTIGNGGRLTLESLGYYTAELNVRGQLTVANGGVIYVPSQDQFDYDTVGIYASGGITVAGGGTIRVESDSYLYTDSNTVVQRGGSIEVDGVMSVNADLTVSGTITLGNSDQAHLSNRRGLTTVQETGEITGGTRSTLILENGRGLTNHGTISVGQLNVVGPMENNGDISLSQYGYFSNTGYSIYNNGTINIASGMDVSVEGTVLLNTGAISGGGTLTLVEVFTYAGYNDGLGADDVRENDSTPGHWDRYYFKADPDATAELTYFIPEFINRGASTVTVRQR